MKILVTGGAGFIGSNFIHLLLRDTSDYSIVNLDDLTYAGNLENLSEIGDDPRYTFVKGDISDSTLVNDVFDRFQPEAVVHFAAESHVDRSIEDAAPFIRTNVQGTQVIIDCLRKYGKARLVHISTDEVYGSLHEGENPFTEKHAISPSSPYAASKAASDLLVLAAHRTHDIDAVVTRCSNNYGPYQFPEKLIPLMIRNAMADEPLPVYGDGTNIRDWIHVDDHCSALRVVLEKGAAGKVYNIGGNSERRNVDVVGGILRILDKPQSLVRFVQDRPGHDFRYAMDISTVERELGWSPAITFEEGLEGTVRWYRDNQWWVEHVLTGEYREFYRRHYGHRIPDSGEND